MFDNNLHNVTMHSCEIDGDFAHAESYNIGLFMDKGSETAKRALGSVDPAIATAKLDLKAVYTNDFVKKANAKYPKG